MGRISHVPCLLSEGLFYDTIASPVVFRLIGVTQQTAILPEAGFFYALAAALGLESEDLVGWTPDYTGYHIVYIVL